jgi:FMN reductase
MVSEAVQTRAQQAVAEACRVAGVPYSVVRAA